MDGNPAHGRVGMKTEEKKFVGEYLEGVPHGSWTGFHSNGQKKYEGDYKFGHQVGKWIYFNKKVIKV